MSDAPRQAVSATALEDLLAGLRLGLFPSSPRMEADAAALSRVSNWRDVAELSRFHQVYGLLLQGLQTLPEVLAASGIEAELRAAQKRQALAVMRQLGALRQALDCFREQDVPVLVLKGLPLSERLYGTPFARRSVDVDLLVDRDSSPPAGRCCWRVASRASRITARRLFGAAGTP